MKRDAGKILADYRDAYLAANGKECEITELPRKRFKINSGFNGTYYLSDIERLTANLKLRAKAIRFP